MLGDFSDPPQPSGSRDRHSPSPGDRFRVPGRPEPLVVAQLIAAFREEAREHSRYLIEAPDGSRWIHQG